MGGTTSTETPQEEVKERVEEKTAETPAVEASAATGVKKEPEPKKNKMPDNKKKPIPDAGHKSSPPKAPVPPGAQTSATLAPKQPAKALSAKKKVQQAGPPQQPGLITPENQGKKGGKGEKGEKGKGGKKGGGFPGIQLCVRNLVKDATPDQLKTMFLPFGDLLSVDVKKNTDGTCRGYGFVTFAKMEDAKKAIAQMDNKHVEGKNLVVVLSDRQQGTTKAERESQATTIKGGKGKDAKGAEPKGKGGAKGKAKGPPAPPAPGAPAQAWPYGQAPEASYPYNYAYPMISPMVAYANQGYPNSQQAAAIAMQAQLLQAQQQTIQSPAAWYSPLNQMGLHQQMAPGNVPQSSPPTVSLAAATPGPPAASGEESRPNLNQEYEGTLKSISNKNGYGFIACDETKVHYKRDVFVDSALLPEGIQVNDKVTFSLALSEKGHPRATSVKLVGQVLAAR